MELGKDTPVFSLFSNTLNIVCETRSMKVCTDVTMCEKHDTCMLPARYYKKNMSSCDDLERRRAGEKTEYLFKKCFKYLRKK